MTFRSPEEAWIGSGGGGSVLRRDRKAFADLMESALALGLEGGSGPGARAAGSTGRAGQGGPGAAGRAGSCPAAARSRLEPFPHLLVLLMTVFGNTREFGGLASAGQERGAVPTKRGLTCRVLRQRISFESSRGFFTLKEK